MSDEQAFVERLMRDGCCPPSPRGPGDDAALLGTHTVVTADAIVEGVHFESGTPLTAVATKALAVNLSDVCAMGARPTGVLVVAQIPPGTDAAALADGLLAAARAFGVPLLGGDTVAAAPGGLALSLTAFGELDGRAPWLRSGGLPGDVLVVTGPLGGSLAARHLCPNPRIDVVAALHSRGQCVHAAMDLSDGLGTDLPRLAAASGLAAVVVAADIPVHTDVAPGRNGLVAALGDGEDFELLLAMPREADLEAAFAGLSPRPIVIGELTAGAGCRLRQAGRLVAWPGGGHCHAF